MDEFEGYLNHANWHLYNNTLEAYWVEGSVITKVYPETDLNGSVWVKIEHTIPLQYAIENELWYQHRILELRIIKGKNDEGSPITSYADTEKGMRKA